MMEKQGLKRAPYMLGNSTCNIRTTFININYIHAYIHIKFGYSHSQHTYVVPKFFNVWQNRLYINIFGEVYKKMMEKQGLKRAPYMLGNSTCNIRTTFININYIHAYIHIKFGYSHSQHTYVVL